MSSTSSDDGRPLVPPDPPDTTSGRDATVDSTREENALHDLHEVDSSVADGLVETPPEDASLPLEVATQGSIGRLEKGDEEARKTEIIDRTGRAHSSSISPTHSSDLPVVDLVGGREGVDGVKDKYEEGEETADEMRGDPLAGTVDALQIAAKADESNDGKKCSPPPAATATIRLDSVDDNDGVEKGAEKHDELLEDPKTKEDIEEVIRAVLDQLMTDVQGAEWAPSQDATAMAADDVNNETTIDRLEKSDETEGEADDEAAPALPTQKPAVDSDETVDGSTGGADEVNDVPPRDEDDDVIVADVLNETLAILVGEEAAAEQTDDEGSDYSSLVIVENESDDDRSMAEGEGSEGDEEEDGKEKEMEDEVHSIVLVGQELEGAEARPRAAKVLREHDRLGVKVSSRRFKKTSGKSLKAIELRSRFRGSFIREFNAFARKDKQMGSASKNLWLKIAEVGHELKRRNMRRKMKIMKRARNDTKVVEQPADEPPTAEEKKTKEESGSESRTKGRARETLGSPEIQQLQPDGFEEDGGMMDLGYDGVEMEEEEEFSIVAAAEAAEAAAAAETHAAQKQKRGRRSKKERSDTPMENRYEEHEGNEELEDEGDVGSLDQSETEDDKPRMKTRRSNARVKKEVLSDEEDEVEEESRYPKRANRSSRRTQEDDESSMAGSKMSDSSVAASSAMPEWLDKLMKNATYAGMVKKCSPRWMKAYSLRKTPNPKVVDYKIVEEVYSRSGEGFKKWDKQDKESGASSYQLDYLVGTTNRAIGKNITNNAMVLIKYSGYPVPSWQPVKIINGTNAVVLQDFKERLQDEDLVEMAMRAERGDAEFNKSYPNRYLQLEEGEGNGGYVTVQLSLYKNRLMAIETEWNATCARWGAPRIMIIDWTSEPEDDANLRALMFSLKLDRSPAVKKMLSKLHQMEDVKCEDGFKCESNVDECCNRGSDELYVNSKSGEMRFRKNGDPPCPPIDGNLEIECSSVCRCSPKCKNRATQNGRQRVLAIVRDPSMGWTVRCVSPIKEGNFIEEYTGELLCTAERKKRSNYQFENLVHPYGAVKATLYIEAAHKGNASRFFCHSCDSNAVAKPTVVERDALVAHRVSIYASRDIQPGEQITLDYFPDKDASTLNVRAMFNGACKCRMPNCRFTKKMIREAEKQQDKRGMKGSEKKGFGGGGGGKRLARSTAVARKTASTSKASVEKERKTSRMNCTCMERSTTASVQPTKPQHIVFESEDEADNGKKKDEGRTTRRSNSLSEQPAKKRRAVIESGDEEDGEERKEEKGEDRVQQMRRDEPSTEMLQREPRRRRQTKKVEKGEKRDKSPCPSAQKVKEEVPSDDDVDEERREDEDRGHGEENDTRREHDRQSDDEQSEDEDNREGREEGAEREKRLQGWMKEMTDDQKRVQKDTGVANPLPPADNLENEDDVNDEIDIDAAVDQSEARDDSPVLVDPMVEADGMENDDAHDEEEEEEVEEVEEEGEDQFMDDPTEVDVDDEATAELDEAAAAAAAAYAAPPPSDDGLLEDADPPPTWNDETNGEEREERDDIALVDHDHDYCIRCDIVERPELQLGGAFDGGEQADVFLVPEYNERANRDRSAGMMENPRSVGRRDEDELEVVDVETIDEEEREEGSPAQNEQGEQTVNRRRRPPGSRKAQPVVAAAAAELEPRTYPRRDRNISLAWAGHWKDFDMKHHEAADGEERGRRKRGRPAANSMDEGEAAASSAGLQPSNPDEQPEKRKKQQGGSRRETDDKEWDPREMATPVNRKRRIGMKKEEEEERSRLTGRKMEEQMMREQMGQRRYEREKKARRKSSLGRSASGEEAQAQEAVDLTADEPGPSSSHQQYYGLEGEFDETMWMDAMGGQANQETKNTPNTCRSLAFAAPLESMMALPSGGMPTTARSSMGLKRGQKKKEQPVNPSHISLFTPSTLQPTTNKKDGRPMRMEMEEEEEEGSDLRTTV